jgi:two-component system, response regulator FlrC
MLNRVVTSLEHSPGRVPASSDLSIMDRVCIEHLVGRRLSLIEREFILQTLKQMGGNRTHAANALGISIRSLRDRIRNYRDQGENVPSSVTGH